MSIGLNGGDPVTPRTKIIVIKPSLNPLSQGNHCTAEAVAYAAAEVALNEAQEAMQQAYDRWYECEMGARVENARMRVALGKEYSILQR